MQRENNPHENIQEFLKGLLICLQKLTIIIESIRVSLGWALISVMLNSDVGCGVGAIVGEGVGAGVAPVGAAVVGGGVGA